MSWVHGSQPLKDTIYLPSAVHYQIAVMVGKQVGTLAARSTCVSDDSMCTLCFTDPSFLQKGLGEPWEPSACPIGRSGQCTNGFKGTVSTCLPTAPSSTFQCHVRSWSARSIPKAVAEPPLLTPYGVLNTPLCRDCYRCRIIGASYLHRLPSQSPTNHSNRHLLHRPIFCPLDEFCPRVRLVTSPYLVLL